MPHDREPAHLLGVTQAVGDDPVARDQLRGHVATVANRDRVGERMLPFFRIGLFGQVAHCNRIGELGLGHARILGACPSVPKIAV